MYIVCGSLVAELLATQIMESFPAPVEAVSELVGWEERMAETAVADANATSVTAECFSTPR